MILKYHSLCFAKTIDFTEQKLDLDLGYTHFLILFCLGHARPTKYTFQGLSWEFETLVDPQNSRMQQNIM